MVLLAVYLFIALFFSFLCSVAEAVILSVTPAYVAALEKEGKPSGKLLASLKNNINDTLAAILTLNTIAHTAGAAGVGAQATEVFGSKSLTIVSIILTILILVLSEIIPKSLGAAYWKQLSGVTAQFLAVLVWPMRKLGVLKLFQKLTSGMTHGSESAGLSRSEFAAMVDISEQEGLLVEQESKILKNLFLLHEMRVKDVMTPSTVVFALSEEVKVEEFFHKYDYVQFSRIPIYEGRRDQVKGFVLRSDLLLAQARGNSENRLSNYSREIEVTLDSIPLSSVFDEMLKTRAQIMLVVDEYGSMKGVLTLEDMLETLLGLEIIDERDKNVDMQQLARDLWKKRAATMGIELKSDDESNQS
ncbi:CNNM domain-containing protein [Persicirhabdus sediminis]|uniref:DUF21 domain-containing protein n=1 Tax=Persicirhabdus sediminis TaxID=454144 RepID=A0A8J7MF87_9BACT|nr:CNNM domain-containing protein [Persicirhabdus sediminis]MBK1791626.1 DUF21 domain-containing protein [Persicirhabdus sediminis]